MKQYSISPDGEKFQLPEPDDYTKEFERLKDSVLDQRELGREIVVVMGVGFVGAVMAAVVAEPVAVATESERIAEPSPSQGSVDAPLTQVPDEPQRRQSLTGDERDNAQAHAIQGGTLGTLPRGMQPPDLKLVNAGDLLNVDPADLEKRLSPRSPRSPMKGAPLAGLFEKPPKGGEGEGADGSEAALAEENIAPAVEAGVEEKEDVVEEAAEEEKETKGAAEGESAVETDEAAAEVPASAAEGAVEEADSVEAEPVVREEDDEAQSVVDDVIANGIAAAAAEA